MIEASVLIVSYRTRELTVRAVLSCLQSYSEAEVIVVDNASGDGTAAALTALQDPRVTLLTNENNVGFGAAHNRAAGVARTSTLVLLNSDAEIDRPGLESLVAEVDSYGGRCIVGPRLRSQDGTTQRSVGVLHHL